MPLYNNILVATDFSSCSSAALSQSLGMIEAASVRIVHVIDSRVAREVMAETNATEDEVKQLARAEVNKQLEKLKGCTPEPEVVVRIGETIGGILEEAKTFQADLIVLGAFGNFGPDLGTVSGRIARKSEHDVLLVQEDHASRFHHIVACVDIKGEIDTLSPAISFAQRNSARLDLLHVHHSPFDLPHHRALFGGSKPKYDREFNVLLSARIDERLAEHKAQLEGLKVRTVIEDNLNPGRGITTYASSQHADLVVIGSRGRSRIRDLFLGSTAERVLSDIVASLLVVKARKAPSDTGQ